MLMAELHAPEDHADLIRARPLLKRLRLAGSNQLGGGTCYPLLARRARSARSRIAWRNASTSRGTR